MILSGKRIKNECIKGNITISNFNINRLNPNSYNLRLNNKLKIYKTFCLDMKRKHKTEEITISESGYILQPNQLYLGRTEEYTETQNYVPMLEGRSSLARLGLSIHATAGFGDIGFCGYWTLEISCIHPVIIYPLVEICQIYYYNIDGEFDTYDGGKYQRNKGIQASKMYKEFE